MLVIGHGDRARCDGEPWVKTWIICWFASGPPMALTAYTISHRPAIAANAVVSGARLRSSIKYPR